MASAFGILLSTILATAVAGIYGLNFKYMPELGWSFGYPAALLLTLAICGTL
jgi:magnesium transporter